VAEVRRGFTTGADPWFYVSDITKSTDAKEIKQMIHRLGYQGKHTNLRLIQSGDETKWLVEKEYLHPVVRNPDKYRNIFIKLQSLKDFVVVVNEPRGKIKGKLIEKYILHGEKKAYKMGKGRSLIPAKTETCSSRQYWYQLPDIQPSRVLWQKAFDVSYRHYLVSSDVLANQRFYHIYPQNIEDVEIIASFLNSPVVSLYLEFQRSIMGLGAIEATVDEVKQVLVVNPRVISDPTKSRLSDAINNLGQREVGSVFDEIGASFPNAVSLLKIKPDRRELDKIIMGEILGLSDEEQLEIYRAVVDLVKSRTEKAKSVGKSAKGGEGIDVEAFKNLIVAQINREAET